MNSSKTQAVLNSVVVPHSPSILPRFWGFPDWFVSARRTFDHTGSHLLRIFRHHDQFHDFVEWPRWLQQIFINSHKSLNERYRLWMFFYRNGMPPEVAVFWTMWHGGYDSGAWRAILHLASRSLTVSGRSVLDSYSGIYIISNNIVA